MMQRSQIEPSTPGDIAGALKQAFEKFCATTVS
jgi:hypothetical protein